MYEVSQMLFGMGIYGVISNRRNLILMLMSLELMLLGVNVSMVISGNILDDMRGVMSVIYILTVAAAESAIGLGLIVSYYRVRGDINILYSNRLRG